MDYQALVDQLTPEIVDRFRVALERGRWPDGRALSAEQKEHCMQAVITYEARHRPETERVGYIDRGSKGGAETDRPTPLNWADSDAPGSDE